MINQLIKVVFLSVSLFRSLRNPKVFTQKKFQKLFVWFKTHCSVILDPFCGESYRQLQLATGTGMTMVCGCVRARARTHTLSGICLIYSPNETEVGLYLLHCLISVHYSPHTMSAQQTCNPGSNDNGGVDTEPSLVKGKLTGAETSN